MPAAGSRGDDDRVQNVLVRSCGRAVVRSSMIRRCWSRLRRPMTVPLVEADPSRPNLQRVRRDRSTRPQRMTSGGEEWTPVASASGRVTAHVLALGGLVGLRVGHMFASEPPSVDRASLPVTRKAAATIAASGPVLVQVTSMTSSSTRPDGRVSPRTQEPESGLPSILEVSPERMIHRFSKSQHSSGAPILSNCHDLTQTMTLCYVRSADQDGSRDTAPVSVVRRVVRSAPQKLANEPGGRERCLG